MADTPDPSWAKAHAPDLPLAAMSDFEFDQYHFKRTRELQAEAAAEEQAMLRQLALLRQRLSKRITDQLRQLGDDRQAQTAELRKRYAEAREKQLKDSEEVELEGRGFGYGIEDTEEETQEDIEAREAEKAREEEEKARRAAKEEERRRAAVAAAEAEDRRRREEAEAAQAEARRRVMELAARRKREEEEARRAKMRERRAREDQAGWRMRAINLEVANNIRYIDVPWPVSSGGSSSTSITSPAAINAHLAHITPEAVRSFLNSVAEIDLELQDRKDATLFPDADSSFTDSTSSKTDRDETADRVENARRRAVRDAIRIFHPDKFYHRVLPRVRQAERGKVREGVERTSRVLNDLLATFG